jgi:hypothetical protein
MGEGLLPCASGRTGGRTTLRPIAVESCRAGWSPIIARDRIRASTGSPHESVPRGEQPNARSQLVGCGGSEMSSFGGSPISIGPAGQGPRSPAPPNCMSSGLGHLPGRAISPRQGGYSLPWPCRSPAPSEERLQPEGSEFRQRRLSGFPTHDSPPIHVGARRQRGLTQSRTLPQLSKFRPGHDSSEARRHRT